MSLLEIRPATAADLAAVTGIYDHAVRHGTATFELIAPDLAEMTRRFDALMDGEAKVIAGGLKSKAQGEVMKVMPDKVKAAMHREQTKPGSGV